MMLEETKTKIEKEFDAKQIISFLKVLDTSTARKIGIPDLRAYVEAHNKIVKSKVK